MARKRKSPGGAGGGADRNGIDRGPEPAAPTPAETPPTEPTLTAEEVESFRPPATGDLDPEKLRQYVHALGYFTEILSYCATDPGAGPIQPTEGATPGDRPPLIPGPVMRLPEFPFLPMQAMAMNAALNLNLAWFDLDTPLLGAEDPYQLPRITGLWWSHVVARGILTRVGLRYVPRRHPRGGMRLLLSYVREPDIGRPIVIRPDELAALKLALRLIEVSPESVPNPYALGHRIFGDHDPTAGVMLGQRATPDPAAEASSADVAILYRDGQEWFIEIDRAHYAITDGQATLLIALAGVANQERISLSDIEERTGFTHLERARDELRGPAKAFVDWNKKGHRIAPGKAVRIKGYVAQTLAVDVPKRD